MKVKFFTLGCKVNQYETQALIEDFSSAGYEKTDTKADLYVINTCTVTSRADRKSKDAVVRARKENPNAKIALCGCLAQGSQKAIECLGADYIIPQDKKSSLVDLVSGRRRGDKGIWSLKISSFSNQRAFVKIQDGCDNFCSFCKVPYVRGMPSSRPHSEVAAEVERLSLSHREVVLCGTNICLYGRGLEPPGSLCGLVKDTLKIASLGRLRLSSLEPYLVNAGLLSCFSHKKICPHLHLSFQSGDDKILKMMNKKETVALYEKIVKKARKINPCVAISCDLIVGFPGEDESSFKNTVKFLKKVKPMRMHIFTFSPRERTPLHRVKLENQRLARKRYNFLTVLSKELALKYKMMFLGKTLQVITEEEKEGLTCGYTENYIKVYLKEKLPLGKICPVKIKNVREGRVFAESA